MKLRSFRVLRSQVAPDSPFAFDLLVRKADGSALRSAANAAALSAANEAAKAASLASSKNSALREKAAHAGLEAAELGAAAAAAETAENRALFVCSPSPLLETAQLLRILESFGQVEAVYDKTTAASKKQKASVRLVHVVFNQETSCSRVLEAASSLESAEEEKASERLACWRGGGRGSASPLTWLLQAAALVKPPRSLKREADGFMRSYDLRKELSKQQKKTQVVDEDGFILVQGQRNAVTDGEQMRGFKAASANFGHISTDPSLNLFKAQAAAAAPGASVQPKQSKKRGRLQLVGDDFYRFQVKESRRRKILEEERRADADAKKMASLDAVRNFHKSHARELAVAACICDVSANSLLFGRLRLRWCHAAKGLFALVTKAAALLSE